MMNVNNKVKVVSIGDYKEKAQEKAKWVKEFEDGPQPIAGCTCGQHTDPNEFLTEKQVTEHYLKDRKRYVKGLQGQDPLEIYMETVESLMSETPLVKLNMETDLATMTYLSNHFNKGRAFYEQYIEGQQELTDTARTKAKELIIGYKGYKEHIVKMLINSYIISKLRFNKENFDFAWTKDELLTREDRLDTSISETQGYISFMEDHFQKADVEISRHTLSIVAENLNRQINKKLSGHHISPSEIDLLGSQMQESLQIIKEVIANNRERDRRIIKEEYDQVKDYCSLEHKAKTLIDIELRDREISECEYTEESGFTVNSSTEKLTESNGMENLIGRLSTKELATLFQKFKALEE